MTAISDRPVDGAVGPAGDGRDGAPVLSTRGRLARELTTTGMVWRRELLRFKRSPARVVSGLAQPIIFLFVLGGGLSRQVGRVGTSGPGYQAFLFPGVIAMSVLFSSVFSAISIVWDREFGFLREMLVAPVSRSALVLGKAVGGGSVAVAQGSILLLTAPLVHVHLSPLNVVKMLALLLVLAFALTAFGIVVASRMQRIESFQVIMSVVVNPMLFLSGAIFPLNRLPVWLQVATRVNPVTYGVDPIRRVLLGDTGALTFGHNVVPIGAEVAITLTLGIAMLMLATRWFHRTD